MTSATTRFIEFCWMAWVLCWVIMAFAAKRTVERRGLIRYRLVALVPLAVWIIATRLAHVSLQSQLWQTGLALGVVSDCIVVAGAAFTLWARVALGRNWSAEVVFKQDHELIETGPYALARHPIYTGIITMGFGTAIDYGQSFGFVLFLALCAGLWWKAREEEQIMSAHFPEAYAAYKARVRAIIPYVLQSAQTGPGACEDNLTGPLVDIQPTAAPSLRGLKSAQANQGRSHDHDHRDGRPRRRAPGHSA